MWEPVSASGIRFTAIQALTDANGMFTVTLLVEGHPLVSEDGQSFTDSTGDTRVTMRDTNNVVLLDDTIATGMTAVRITLCSLVLPMVPATPTSEPVTRTVGQPSAPHEASRRPGWRCFSTPVVASDACRKGALRRGSGDRGGESRPVTGCSRPTRSPL